MPHVIIADANEGRRALLASSIERDGFQVTRTSTLAQAEGTVRATVPEVLLLEEEWPDGSALDVAQALSSDPAVGARTRIVMLARSTAPDMMLAAARAGVAEVLGKPLDMGHLLQQLRAHAEKRMVAPPAQVPMASATGYGGSTPLGAFAAPPPQMDGGAWALPMLRGLLGTERINADVVEDVLEGGSLEGLDATGVAELIRKTIGRLLEESGTTGPEPAAPAPVPARSRAGLTVDDLTKSATLGSGEGPAVRTAMLSGDATGGMEAALQRQADSIANDVEAAMSLLDEPAPRITAPLAEGQRGVDLETLSYVRLCVEDIRDLLWDLGRPGAVSDTSLMTRVEDATGFAEEILAIWPQAEQDEGDGQV